MVEGTKRLKKLTAGMNYKNGSVEFGMEQFEREYTRQQQLNAEKLSKEAKKQETVKKHANKVKAIMEKPEGQWSVVEYRAMCQWKRHKDDKPITKMNRSELVKEWAVRRLRPNPDDVDQQEQVAEVIAGMARQAPELDNQSACSTQSGDFCPPGNTKEPQKRQRLTKTRLFDSDDDSHVVDVPAKPLAATRVRRNVPRPHRFREGADDSDSGEDDGKVPVFLQQLAQHLAESDKESEDEA